MVYVSASLSNFQPCLSFIADSIQRVSDRNGKSPVVVWSGIQRSLEMAQSDVLILLDCCSSGVANASEGNGVTELICASPFDTKANGVGHYSFTRALITELRLLSKKPCISVGELYTYIYTRIQSYLPQGIENERYPAPIHLVLTDGEPFTRGIKLSVQDHNDSCHGSEGRRTKREPMEDPETSSDAGESESSHSARKRFCLDTTSGLKTEEVTRPWVDAFSSFKEENGPDEAGPCSQEEPKARSTDQVQQPDEGIPRNSATNVPLFPQDAPRALFAIRFREDVRGEDLSVELFREWLRSIPAAAEEVRVEAGFKCFSTLILITVPIAMCSYIPQDHAMFFLGPVKSPIIFPAEAQPVSICRNEETIEDAFSKPLFDTSKYIPTPLHKTHIVKSEPFPDSKLNILKYLPPYASPTVESEASLGSLSTVPGPTPLPSVSVTGEPEPLRKTSLTTLKSLSPSESPLTKTSQATPLKARRIPRPKVKTGCINCTIRRVKCDETRPQCQKCVRAGRICDGYPGDYPAHQRVIKVPAAFPSPPASIASSSSSSITLPSIQHIIKGPMQTLTSLTFRSTPANEVPTDPFFDAQEEQYFQFFRTHAASALSGYFNSEFWSRTVLQESHSEASIRHNVVALGALYKYSEGMNDSGLQLEPEHYIFALQQRSKALARLRESLTDDGSRSIRTILISIILFTCFQSLRGDYMEVASQLQHGLYLLRERAADPKRNDKAEDELVHIIQRLAVQARFCDMLLHLPSLYRFRLTPALEESNSSQSSMSRAEAFNNIPSMSLVADMLPADMLKVDVPAVPATSLEARSILYAICEHSIRLVEKASSHPYIRFDAHELVQWSIAFDPLFNGRYRTGVTIEERAAINSLKMLQLMVYVIFPTSLTAEVLIHFHSPQACFLAILRLGEMVMADEELAGRKDDSAWQSRPSFTSEMFLVAPLFFVATNYRDRTQRRRAIEMLLLKHRREGLLDSRFCAKVAELVMEIEERGMIPYDTLDHSTWEHLPEAGVLVTIKETTFDLQERSGKLKYETENLGNEIVEIGFSW